MSKHPDLSLVTTSMTSHFSKLIEHYGKIRHNLINFDQLKKDIVDTINNKNINASNELRNKYKHEISKINSAPTLLKWLCDKYLAGSNNKVLYGKI